MRRHLVVKSGSQSQKGPCKILGGGWTFRQTGCLSTIFNELWSLDVNRMTPGIDYTISFQGRASFVSQGIHTVLDHASQPLFSNVNESKLRNITTFSSFVTLLDNYERSTGVTEQVTTEELTEMDLFLDAVLETKVMKVCVTTSSVEQKVYICEILQHYNLICISLVRSMCVSVLKLIITSLDSSGFEHVFVGETKSGTEIIGFHNWVQFYLQEKNQHLDYKGYKAREHDLPDQDDHVLNLQFSWHGVVKPVGSAFIGTSPEFEMAVFLMNMEGSTTVVVNIDQCQMELVVIRHGRSLGTAYPKLLSSNSRHVRQHAH
ncbi:poly(U)-specific endoribonuclease-C [Haplochromis burtoni]|uniref:poly(U)-specific endoribonuclease-C n=1 Tax=Haplochromis burtoni TaxID=8153 RepID=UPI001C2D0F42|nr:poly(U)-specific endoribonuclease-C [Haplochromis burtoni]